MEACMRDKPLSERVPVNKTGETCGWCGQIKTGYRSDKSLHYLFRFRTIVDNQEIEGLFCSLECMRAYHSDDRYS
jgi:hypothetical protein